MNVVRRLRVIGKGRQPYWRARSVKPAQCKRSRRRESCKRFATTIRLILGGLRSRPRIRPHRSGKQNQSAQLRFDQVADFGQ